MPWTDHGGLTHRVCLTLTDKKQATDTICSPKTNKPKDKLWMTFYNWVKHRDGSLTDLLQDNHTRPLTGNVNSKQCNVSHLIANIWSSYAEMKKWDKRPYKCVIRSSVSCHALKQDKTPTKHNASSTMKLGTKMQQTRRIHNKTLTNTESLITNPHTLLNKWDQKFWQKASQCFHQ